MEHVGKDSYSYEPTMELWVLLLLLSQPRHFPDYLTAEQKKESLTPASWLGKRLLFFMGDSLSEWKSRNRKWMVQHLMVVFFCCFCLLDLLDDQPNLNTNNKSRPKFFENWSMSWSLCWLLLVIKRSNGHVICCEFSWWATSCQVSRFCPISSLFCPISSFAPGSFKTCSGWMKTTPQI